MSGGRGDAARPAAGGWPAAAWVVAFVLFLGGVGVARDARFYLPQTAPVDVRLATYAHSVAAPAIWAGIFLLVLRITRRATLTGRRDGLKAIALAAGLTGVHYLVEAAAAWVAPPSSSRAAGAFSRAVVTFPTSMGVTLALLAAGYAVAQEARRKEQEERGARLSADLSRARMQGLESQLRPHFLFNVLQSVATLMHRDVQAARAMLARLRVLLERSLAVEQASRATLREELALLRLYTDIEAVRFGERLRVEIEMEGDAEDASVPAFLLQPLVENAIRHAVEVRGEGTIRIRGRRDGPGEPLHLHVADTGAPASDAPPRPSSGIGLANTRSRLELLYGGDYALWMERSPSDGTVVHVRIPAAPAPGPDA